jgi:hypothetical protein
MILYIELLRIKMILNVKNHGYILTNHRLKYPTIHIKNILQYM